MVKCLGWFCRMSRLKLTSQMPSGGNSFRAQQKSNWRSWIRKAAGYCTVLNSMKSKKIIDPFFDLRPERGAFLPLLNAWHKIETESGKTVHKDNADCSNQGAMINTMERNRVTAADGKKIGYAQDIANGDLTVRNIRQNSRQLRSRFRSCKKKCGKIFQPKDAHKDEWFLMPGKFLQRGQPLSGMIRIRSEPAAE